MAFDEILVQLGEFGIYQKRSIILYVCLISIPDAVHKFAQVFYAGPADYWCATQELNNTYMNCSHQLDEKQCIDIIQNYSVESVQYMQLSSELQSADPCIDSTEGDVSVPCETGWIFDHTQYKSTIIEDFDLVCNKSNLPHIAQSVYFAGTLAASFVFGSIADWVGRTKTMFVSLIIWFFSAVGIIFTTDIYTYMTLRFFTAFSSYGINIPGYILVNEFVGPSKRNITGVTSSFSFALGIMILAGIAYYIRNWRYLQVALTAPLLVSFLYIRFLYESARWLISVGKYEEAEKVIRKVAKVNRKTLPPVLFDDKELDAQEDNSKTGRVSALALFKTPNITLKTINIMWNMFVNSSLYYGIMLYTPDLGSDPYLAFFLTGLIEIPALVYVPWAIENFGGRKLNLAGALFVSGLISLLIGFMPPGLAVMCVAMIGKCSVTASYAIIYIFSVELFPTPVRSAGTGLSIAFSGIGGIVAPLILLLSETWAPLPFVVFGSLGICAGLMALMLPETRGQNLPDTLEEGEQFGKPDWLKRLCGNTSHEDTSDDVEMSATSEPMMPTATDAHQMNNDYRA